MGEAKRRKLLDPNYGKPKLVDESLFKLDELVVVNTMDSDELKPKGRICYVENLNSEWFYTIQFDVQKVAQTLAIWSCLFIPVKYKRLRAVSLLGSRQYSIAIIPERFLYQDEEDMSPYQDTSLD